MANNTGPAFTEGENWFTVLGVYFPTVTGVMAGISKFNKLISLRFKFNSFYLNYLQICLAILKIRHVISQMEP